MSLRFPASKVSNLAEFEAWLAGDYFQRLALEANHPERLLSA